MQRALQPERAESARRAQRRGPSLAPPPPLPASLPERPRPASVGAPPPSQSRRTALPVEPMAALSARGHLTQGAVVIRRGEAGGARQRGWAPAGSRWRERGRERARAPGQSTAAACPEPSPWPRCPQPPRPPRAPCSRALSCASLLLQRGKKNSFSWCFQRLQSRVSRLHCLLPCGFWKPLSRAWLEAPRNCISTGSPNQPLPRRALLVVWKPREDAASLSVLLWQPRWWHGTVIPSHLHQLLPASS
ncbi:uncharacterized protein LOC128103158 [Peromyscus californicus insignis]|uniref:uncharacterized protein LOC128103158 n=1 Tax=Peromyscus californicus insignis TaxID=564181 RepID=UPI0022A77C98|nr:uncharacterized protein LOC128103158 [Peromyscus californicus insignis]